MTVERVAVTEEAAALIRKLKTLHGDLMFHQSGGCCDGSSPMCYPQGEFSVGQRDVRDITLGFTSQRRCEALRCPLQFSFYLRQPPFEESGSTFDVLSPGPRSELLEEGIDRRARPVEFAH